MTRHPKDPGPGAMASAALFTLIAILISALVLAHCSDPKPPGDHGLPYIVYPDTATCEPWPQCQDVEPPPRPEKE